MVKRLFLYEGPVWNSGTIYKRVTEYTHAHSKYQALAHLKYRLKRKYPRIAFIELKEQYITEIKEEIDA